MEQAILKTLIYADIFDYPLKAYEIHKWLIDRTASLRQIETGLKKLLDREKVIASRGYYFLPGRNKLAAKRQRKRKQSVIYLRKARLLGSILRAIPWVKLVGISGGLAMENAEKGDDIDLFIVTLKNRLWLSRLLALILLSVTGQRRKKGQVGKIIAGKVCLNILLEEDRLAQNKGDIYLAHEVLQMKVLWQRGGIYQKYLEDNEWVFRFLPNWMGITGGTCATLTTRDTFIRLERLAKWLQLKIMKEPKGMERIEDGALYFHPKDCRMEVLAEYQRRTKKISRA